MTCWSRSGPELKDAVEANQELQKQLDEEREQACAILRPQCWTCMHECTTAVAHQRVHCRACSIMQGVQWRSAHLRMHLALPAEMQHRGCHAAQKEELRARIRSLRQDQERLRGKLEATCGKLEVRLVLWEYC